MTAAILASITEAQQRTALAHQELLRAMARSAKIAEESRKLIAAADELEKSPWSGAILSLPIAP